MFTGLFDFNRNYILKTPRIKLDVTKAGARIVEKDKYANKCFYITKNRDG